MNKLLLITLLMFVFSNYGFTTDNVENNNTLASPHLSSSLIASESLVFYDNNGATTVNLEIFDINDKEYMGSVIEADASFYYQISQVNLNFIIISANQAGKLTIPCTDKAENHALHLQIRHKEKGDLLAESYPEVSCNQQLKISINK